MMGLFLYFLFDLSIIYIIEFVYNVPVNVNSISPTNGFPAARTIIFSMGIPFYTYFFNILTESKWRWYQALPILLYTVMASISLLPGLDRSFFLDYLFYFSRYFSIILMLSMFLWILRRPGCSLDNSRKKNVLRLDWFILIFMVLSLVETTLVLIFWKQYASWLSTFAPRLSERIFMEDIYSIIITIASIYYCQKAVKEKVELTQAAAAICPIPLVSPKLLDRHKEEFCNSLGLTKREREIISLLLQDKSNQEISDELFISLGTAKTHVHNIFQKAEVTKRRQLIDCFQTFISGK